MGKGSNSHDVGSTWLGASSFIGLEAQDGLGIGNQVLRTRSCQWHYVAEQVHGCLGWTVHNDEWIIEPDRLETMIKPSEEKMRLLRRDYKSGKEFQMPV